MAKKQPGKNQGKFTQVIPKKETKQMRALICQICGRETTKSSNARKYCPDCAKEKIKTNNRTWRKSENGQKCLAAYIEKNREKRNTYSRKYYQDHKIAKTASKTVPRKTFATCQKIMEACEKN